MKPINLLQPIVNDKGKAEVFNSVNYCSVHKEINYLIAIKMYLILRAVTYYLEKL